MRVIHRTLPAPYTHLTGEVVSRIIGTGGYTQRWLYLHGCIGEPDACVFGRGEPKLQSDDRRGQGHRTDSARRASRCSSSDWEPSAFETLASPIRMCRKRSVWDTSERHHGPERSDSRGEDLLALLAQLALRPDVPVERHGGDPEFATELGHGGVAVRHRGLGQPHLGFRERELPAAVASVRPQRRRA